MGLTLQGEISCWVAICLSLCLLDQQATAQVGSPRYAWATVFKHDTVNAGHERIIAVQLYYLRKLNTQHDYVLLAAAPLSPAFVEVMAKLRGKILPFDMFNHTEVDAQAVSSNWSGAFHRMLLWQLEGTYDKIVYLDNDMLPWDEQHHIDQIFGWPELSAAIDIVFAVGIPDHPHIFNSGLMVLEPSNKTANDLITEMKRFAHYQAEMGFLNDFFARKWHVLPISYNLFPQFIREGEGDFTISTSGYGFRVRNIRFVHFVHEKPGTIVFGSADPCAGRTCLQCCFKYLVASKDPMLAPLFT